MRSTFTRRLAASLLLLGLTAGHALAAGQAVTIYDQRDSPLGTSTNPIVVTGGSSGGASNQGTPNAGGTAAWYVQWANQSVAISGALPAGTNVIGGVTQSGGPWGVSGTVTANQGATGAAPWLVSWSGQSVAVSNFPATQAVSAASLPLPAGAATSALQSVTQGPVAPGTAGTASSLIGGVYTSTPPTLTTGQQAAARLDASGNLQVTVTNPNAATSTVSANQGTAGASPWPVSEASGANVALGSTTDTPLSGAASATAATLQAEIKGLYNLLQGGTAKVQTSLWWNENVNTSVAASSTTQGATRSSGGASGSGGPYGYFTVVAFSSQAGTLYAQCTAAGFQQTATVPANTVTTIRLPAFSPSCSAAFIDNTTAGTLSMSDGFTVN